MDFPRDPKTTTSLIARCARVGFACLRSLLIEGLYAAATFCTPASRTHVGLTLIGRETGLSAHQDTASADRDYLDLRSDDRGMSHSANDALELRFEAGLSHSAFNTPAALRFPAASPSGPRRHRPAFSIATTGSAIPVGHEQSRFTLLVTHVGIDDQELGALGDGFAGGALPIRGMPSVRPSRGSARPSRLATFSSCQSHS